MAVCSSDAGHRLQTVDIMRPGRGCLVARATQSAVYRSETTVPLASRRKSSSNLGGLHGWCGNTTVARLKFSWFKSTAFQPLGLRWRWAGPELGCKALTSWSTGGRSGYDYGAPFIIIKHPKNTLPKSQTRCRRLEVSETLEDYLASAYHIDMDDIRDLEDALGQAANVFIYSCENGRWPYEFSNKMVEEHSKQISHGTQAMIAAALGKMTGRSTLASGRRARLKLICEKDLDAARMQGIECLVESIKLRTDLISSTFGKNDPMTLSHAADLLRGMRSQSTGDDAASPETTLEPAISKLRELCEADPATGKSLLPSLPTFHTTQDTDPSASAEQGPRSAGRKPDYLKNAFIPLRIVRGVRDLGNKVVFPTLLTNPEIKEQFYATYRRFLEATLHDHLSFSAIPDSRFDPAELIFCLEGLLLCAKYVVDEKLFERVLDVLKDKQEASAHWRPNKPIYATPQGMTMLPVSVGGAISLLRSISVMEGESDFQHFSTSAVPMIRRFWHWLRARMVQFEVLDPSRPPQEMHSPFDKGKYSNLTGWHSEHVNDPGLIHLWDTSQVIEFMLGYRELLERSVAERLLLLSRLSINSPLRSLPTNWKVKMARNA